MDYNKLLNLCHQSNDNLMFVGLHGLGKSSVVENWAKMNNFHIETIILSIREVGDLIGLPTIKNNYTYYTRPSFIENIEKAHAENRHVVLFLDELNRSTKDIRDASLQICLKGLIGDYQLPILNGIKTFVVAAINPPEYYDVEELDPALNDRFSIIEFKMSLEDWLKWANNNNINQTIIEFLTLKPEYLHTFLKNTNEIVCATPRSWEQVSVFLNTYENMKEDDDLILLNLLKGRLGNSLAIEFMSFYKNKNKNVKIEDILKCVSLENSLEDNIKHIQLFLSKNKIETILLLDLTKLLFNNINFEKKLIDDIYNMCFISFLHTIGLEITTIFLTELKKNNIKSYMQLAELDKTIFVKINNIVHNL